MCLIIMLLLPRYFSLEEEPNSKLRVISLYRDIEQILKSDEFNQDLRNELLKSNPDFNQRSTEKKRRYWENRKLHFDSR